MHHTHQQQTRGMRGHTLPTLMQDIRNFPLALQAPCLLHRCGFNRHDGIPGPLLVWGAAARALVGFFTAHPAAPQPLQCHTPA